MRAACQGAHLPCTLVFPNKPELTRSWPLLVQENQESIVATEGTVSALPGEWVPEQQSSPGSSLSLLCSLSYREHVGRAQRMLGVLLYRCPHIPLKLNLGLGWWSASPSNPGISTYLCARNTGMNNKAQIFTEVTGDLNSSLYDYTAITLTCWAISQPPSSF